MLRQRTVGCSDCGTQFQFVRRGSRSVASAYRHQPNSGTHTPMPSKLADLNPNRRIGFWALDPCANEISDQDLQSFP